MNDLWLVNVAYKLIANARTCLHTLRFFFKNLKWKKTKFVNFKICICK
jgi:hypothetical protein